MSAIISHDGDVRVITHPNGTVVRQHRLGDDIRASFATGGTDVFWVRQGGLGADGSVVAFDAEAVEGLVAALRAEGLI